MSGHASVFRSQTILGGGPRVVVSTAAFHARVRGSVPGLGGLKETKLFLPHPRVKVSIVGSLRDQEVACSASDRQGSNFESCVWRTVSSQSSHHPQKVLLAQFSLYVHKGGLKPDSFHLFPRRYLRNCQPDCMHTSLRGFRCAFWGLWPFTYFFNFYFATIIDFYWWQMISSQDDILRSVCWIVLILHTHPLGGVDVPF